MNQSIGFLDFKRQELLDPLAIGHGILYRMDLPDWIGAARKHNNGNGKLSQEALGELLSVSKQNVNAWEKGRHQPSYAQVVQISRLMGYPLPDQPEPTAPWPFPRVKRDRWEACNDTDRGYVQAAINKALEECEADRNIEHGKRSGNGAP